MFQNSYHYKYNKYKTKYLEAKMQYGGEIFKHNEYTWYKKVDDMYYVMELISDPLNLERKNFWKDYADGQTIAFKTYEQYVQKAVRENKQPPPFGKLRSGALVGNSGNPFFKTLVKKTNNYFQTYVAHVSEKILPNNFSDVEMSVGVLFHPKCPVYTNMGIERGYTYLLHREAGIKTLHPRISSKLHSFTAQILLKMDNSLIYMMTRADNQMTQLLASSFPDSTYYDTTLQYVKSFLDKNIPVPQSLYSKFSDSFDEYFKISQNLQDFREKYTDHEVDQMEEEQTKITNYLSTKVDLVEHIRIRETEINEEYFSKNIRRTRRQYGWIIYDPQEKPILTVDNVSQTITLPDSNYNYIKEFEWLTETWGVPWRLGPYITLNKVQNLANKQ